MRRGLGKKTITLREEILSVLDDLKIPMSSRQVAYQLVGRQVIENAEKEKERVGRIIVDMRYEGIIPYSRIVDRTRAKHLAASWAGVADIMNAAAAQYRRNLWADQQVVPMIACEKRALEAGCPSPANPSLPSSARDVRIPLLSTFRTLLVRKS